MKLLFQLTLLSWHVYLLTRQLKVVFIVRQAPHGWADQVSWRDWTAARNSGRGAPLLVPQHNHSQPLMALYYRRGEQFQGKYASGNCALENAVLLNKLAIASCVNLWVLGIGDTTGHAAQPPLISSSDLTTLPRVHAVTFSAMTATERQIIHLLDWHFVSEADFAADLRDQSNEPICDEEIDDLYEDFLTEVEAVQREQMTILRSLIRNHGLQAVYKEGLTAERLPAFTKLVAAMKDFEMNKPKGETPTEQFLLDQYRLDVLQLGAAGRLLLSGELQAVLPAENAETLAAANPVGPDGKFEFNVEADERREDAIVRSMLDGDRVAIIVLGGDHDLADNVRRVTRGSCQYVRIEPKKYREARR